MEVGVDDGKFYGGWKGKFGLNLQAVCDAKHRFTYISLQHPTSASDYLAFVTSSLYGQLTEGEGQPAGNCLYGDNALAIPFQAMSNGPKDSYNFYHLQVRINIECAFGILTNRWRLHKTPLSAKISISRINALISCLCKLHIFCIDNGNARPPERYSHDPLTLMDFMDSDEPDDSESPHPLGLLGGGEHFADVGGGGREQLRLPHRRLEPNNAQSELLQNSMLRHIAEMDIHHPCPFEYIYWFIIFYLSLLSLALPTSSFTFPKCVMSTKHGMFLFFGVVSSISFSNLCLFSCNFSFLSSNSCTFFDNAFLYMCFCLPDSSNIFNSNSTQAPSKTPIVSSNSLQ